MLRAIGLSLALLIGLGVAIPLSTEYTDAKVQQKAKKKKRSWKGVKKYSTRWWQLYRAQERRKKLRAKQKRQLRVRQLVLARAVNENQTVDTKKNVASKSAQKPTVADSTPAMLPSGDAAPKGWKSGAVSSSELQYRVDDDNGAQIGSASISVIGPAMGADNNGGRNKTVGGVPVVSLRSAVIDRMIKENGWVVNDYQKEIGGKKVYVVVAQSESGGAVQSRMFYFTEVDGRIYSVATSAPNGSSERIVQESEKVIDSLQRRKRQQASK